VDKLKDLAILSAREAGLLLKGRLHLTHKVSFKGDKNLVTEADRLSEELIVKRIRESFPDHDILAEESPATSRGSLYRWIIDPLDGTTNYAHGYPVFSVSIALEISGKLALGVVYNPMLDELFFAEKGQGAFLNEERLSVSRVERLEGSLLATGFPYNIRTSEDNNINYFNKMIMVSQAVRRAGSAALDLAYLAAGRFDGFWELQLKPWDVAAGILLIEEAGGQVTDFSSRPYRLDGDKVAASNGRIHQEFLHQLNR
jgi:myo-inositol-1(or 4)-monophosphatase